MGLTSTPRRLGGSQCDDDHHPDGGDELCQRAAAVTAARAGRPARWTPPPPFSSGCSARRRSSFWCTRSASSCRRWCACSSIRPPPRPSADGAIPSRPARAERGLFALERLRWFVAPSGGHGALLQGADPQRAGSGNDHGVSRKSWVSGARGSGAFGAVLQPHSDHREHERAAASHRCAQVEGLARNRSRSAPAAMLHLDPRSRSGRPIVVHHDPRPESGSRIVIHHDPPCRSSSRIMVHHDPRSRSAPRSWSTSPAAQIAPFRSQRNIFTAFTP